MRKEGAKYGQKATKRSSAAGRVPAAGRGVIPVPEARGGGFLGRGNGGRQAGRYPLAEDRRVTIGAADYNVLEIKDGAAAVAEANCGDHTCVRTGRISREGETIVCLPHRLVVRIEGGDEPLFDADAG